MVVITVVAAAATEAAAATGAAATEAAVTSVAAVTAVVGIAGVKAEWCKSAHRSEALLAKAVPACSFSPRIVSPLLFGGFPAKYYTRERQPRLSLNLSLQSRKLPLGLRPLRWRSPSRRGQASIEDVRQPPRTRRKNS